MSAVEHICKNCDRLFYTEFELDAHANECTPEVEDEKPKKSWTELRKDKIKKPDNETRVSNLR